MREIVEKAGNCGGCHCDLKRLENVMDLIEDNREDSGESETKRLQEL